MATIIDELVVRISGQADMTGLKRFRDGIDRLGRNFTAMGAKMALVGTGAAAAMRGPLKEFGTWESTLLQIKDLVGVTLKDLGTSEAEIKRLAMQYGRDPNQVLSQLYDITSAGLQGAEAMQQLEAALIGSKAGLGDMSAIVRAANDTLNVYGKETINSTEAVDQMFFAIRKGVLQPDSLAPHIAFNLEDARRLNIEYAELLSYYAGISKKGIKPEQSKTWINAVISQIVGQQPKLVKGLKTMGISIEQFQKDIGEHGLVKTLGATDTALKKHGMTFTDLFEDRSAKRIINIMTGDMENFLDIWRAIANESEGAALLGARNRMGTTEDFFERLSANIATFKINMGEATSQSEGFFHYILTATAYLTGLDDTWLRVISTVLQFVSVLLPVGIALSALGFIMTGIAAVFTLVALKVALILSLIGLLIWAGKAIYDNWEGIADFFRRIGEAIGLYIVDKLLALTAAWEGFKAKVGGAWDWLVNLVGFGGGGGASLAPATAGVGGGGPRVVNQSNEFAMNVNADGLSKDEAATLVNEASDRLVHEFERVANNSESNAVE